MGPGLAAMAWRNLWRNRRRTLITLSGIAFGVMLAVLMTSLGDGTYRTAEELLVERADPTGAHGGHSEARGVIVDQFVLLTCSDHRHHRIHGPARCRCSGGLWHRQPP